NGPSSSTSNHPGPCPDRPFIIPATHSIYTAKIYNSPVRGEAEGLVVIVGAGISFDAPTRAPGFGQIRNLFLERCGFEKLVKEEESKGEQGRWLNVNDLSPEQIFNALDDGREETQQQIRADLWRLCETRGPNQNHEAVAKLIGAGAKVWTPNFDTMIE